MPGLLGDLLWRQEKTPAREEETRISQGINEVDIKPNFLNVMTASHHIAYRVMKHTDSLTVLSKTNLK